jgi:hypothetical protein
MRRVAAVLSTAAMLVFAAGVFAQGKPNFSGTWTVDAEKTAAANPNMGGGGGGGRGGGGRGGGGGAMTIAQDATRTTQAGETTMTYKLDGSDSKNTVAGRGGAEPTEQIAKAKWVGSTISVETQGQNGNTTAVYSMEGDWMVIATTRPGRQGGDPTTTKQYYKKG